MYKTHDSVQSQPQISNRDGNLAGRSACSGYGVMYARSSLLNTRNKGLLQVSCKQSNMLRMQTEDRKQFDYMKRAVMRGKFIDPETGHTVDAQTKMISQILRQPAEFRKYGGITKGSIPELFTSELVKRHRQEQALLR